MGGPWSDCITVSTSNPVSSVWVSLALQFFCTYCPCQPNAATMRTTAGAIVNPRKNPEIYVNSVSAQYQTNGRRAGLKIRSSQGDVGSSPTFGSQSTLAPGCDHLSTTNTPRGERTDNLPSNARQIWLMTPVSPRRFRASSGRRNVRVAEEVAGKEEFGGVHSDDPHPGVGRNGPPGRIERGAAPAFSGSAANHFVRVGTARNTSPTDLR